MLKSRGPTEDLEGAEGAFEDVFEGGEWWWVRGTYLWTSSKYHQTNTKRRKMVMADTSLGGPANMM